MRAAHVLTLREEQEYNVTVSFVLAFDLIRYASERSADGRLAGRTKQFREKPSACGLTRLHARRASNSYEFPV